MFTIKTEVPDVMVATSTDGGHSPEFWAQRAADKIVYIGEQAAPEIRQQAEAYKERVREQVYQAIFSAIKSDRQTIAAELEKCGYSVVANQVKFYKNAYRKT